MALEIKITVNAPDLSAALNNFANTITSMMVAGATYPEETAKEIKRAVKPDEKTISPEEATKIREFLKQDAEKKGVEAPKPPAAAEPDEKTKRAELKKLLAAAVRAGKNAEASALIHGLGAKKMSELPTDKLDEAIQKAGEL